jgi:hypothetical protein
LDYFRDKEEVISSCDWKNLEQNFLDKFDALNKTAWALTVNGMSFIAARNLHQGCPEDKAAIRSPNGWHQTEKEKTF